MKQTLFLLISLLSVTLCVSCSDSSQENFHEEYFKISGYEVFAQPEIYGAGSLLDPKTKTIVLAPNKGLESTTHSSLFGVFQSTSSQPIYSIADAKTLMPEVINIPQSIKSQYFRIDLDVAGDNTEFVSEMEFFKWAKKNKNLYKEYAEKGCHVVLEAIKLRSINYQLLGSDGKPIKLSNDNLKEMLGEDYDTNKWSLSESGKTISYKTSRYIAYRSRLLSKFLR